MIHWLAPWLFSEDVCRLLGYISFRAAGAAVTVFLFAVLLGPRVIAWLGQLGVGERIDGTGSATLEALHAHKKGTPTMGGIFIIGGIVLASALWMRFDEPNRFSSPGIFLIAGFAGVGFWDDWVKLHNPKKRGIGKREKQGALTILALIVALWLLGPAGLESAANGPHLYVPFFKDFVVRPVDLVRRAVPAVGGAGAHGRRERGEPHRRHGRPRDRLHRHRGDRLCGDHLRRRPRRLVAVPARAARRRCR
jgi:phospho-N-acetylmuramoyl-pentapeptide-transferase